MKTGRLVLARRKDEVIVIGEGADKIEIVVVRICGDRVKLGISAPKTVPVHRREIHDLIYEDWHDHGEPVG